MELDGSAKYSLTTEQGLLKGVRIADVAGELTVSTDADYNGKLSGAIIKTKHHFLVESVSDQKVASIEKPKDSLSSVSFMAKVETHEHVNVIHKCKLDNVSIVPSSHRIMSEEVMKTILDFLRTENLIKEDVDIREPIKKNKFHIGDIFYGFRLLDSKPEISLSLAGKVLYLLVKEVNKRACTISLNRLFQLIIKGLTKVGYTHDALKILALASEKMLKENGVSYQVEKSRDRKSVV